MLRSFILVWIALAAVWRGEAVAQGQPLPAVVVLQFQPADPGDPRPAFAVYDRVFVQVAGTLQGARLWGGRGLAAELGEGMASCQVVPGCVERVLAQFHPVVLVTGVVGRDANGVVRGRLVLTGGDGREVGVVDKTFEAGGEAVLATALAAAIREVLPRKVDPYAEYSDAGYGASAPRVDPYAAASPAGIGGPSAGSSPGAAGASGGTVAPRLDPYGGGEPGNSQGGSSQANPYVGTATAPVRPETPPTSFPSNTPPVNPYVPAEPRRGAETPPERGAPPRATPPSAKGGRAVGGWDTRGFHLRGGVGYALGGLRQEYSSSIYIDGVGNKTDEYSWATLSFLSYGLSAYAGLGYGVSRVVEIGFDGGLLVGMNAMRKEYATSADSTGTLGQGLWEEHAALFGLLDPRVRFYLFPTSLAQKTRANVYLGLGVPFVITAPFRSPETTVLDAEGNPIGSSKLYDDRPAGLLVGVEPAIGFRGALSSKVSFYLDIPLAVFFADVGVSEEVDADPGEDGNLEASDASLAPSPMRLMVRIQAGLQFRL